MISKVDIIKEKILSDISSGKLIEGQAIQSRHQFMKRSSCSRGVVDKAVGELIKAGFLTGKRGSGTYICKTRLSRSVERIFLIDNRMYSQVYGDISGDAGFIASEIQSTLPCYIYGQNDVKSNLEKMSSPASAVIWMTPPSSQLMVMDYLRKANIPQLLVGREYEGYDYVTTDAKEGIRDGLQWLSKNGGDKVAFITRPLKPELPYIAERQISFYRLCIELRLKNDPKAIFESEFTDLKSEARRIACELFALKGFRSVFLTHFQAAYPFVSVAESIGKNPGEDFFLLVFDEDKSLAGCPGVAMLRQKWREMSEKAVEWTLRRKKDVKSAFKIKIKPELIF